MVNENDYDRKCRTPVADGVKSRSAQLVLVRAAGSIRVKSWHSFGDVDECQVTGTDINAIKIVCRDRHRQRVNIRRREMSMAIFGTDVNVVKSGIVDRPDLAGSGQTVRKNLYSHHTWKHK